MPQADLLRQNRREARYPVRQQSPPWTWIRVTDTDPWQPVRLVDISRHGLRMELSEQPQIDDRMQLRLAPGQSIEEVQATLRVRWTQMSVRGQWWVGCQLEPTLDQAWIDSLAAATLVERRKEPRVPVHCPAQVKWELAEGWHSAELCDYSAEGFRLRLPTTVTPPTDRLLVRLDPQSEGGTATEIPARIAWQRDAGRERLLGCVMLHHQHYSQLRQSIGHPVPSATVEWDADDSLTGRRLAGLAAAVVLMAALSAFVWFCC